MKYSWIFVFCVSCVAHPSPTPTVVIDPPKAEPKQPEVLLPMGLLETRVREECVGRYKDSAYIRVFCACLAGVVVENVRSRGITTVREFHEHVEEVVPTEAQIRGCKPDDGPHAMAEP